MQNLIKKFMEYVVKLGGCGLSEIVVFVGKKGEILIEIRQIFLTEARGDIHPWIGRSSKNCENLEYL